MQPAEGLEPTMLSLARQLEHGIDRLVAAMVDHLLAEPSLGHYDEPRYRELAHRVARENLLHEIHALQQERELPESCPPQAAMAVQYAVRLNAPVTVILQSYHAGHAVLWAAWLELVESVSAAAEVRSQLLEAGSTFMLAYVERCTSFVVQEYTRLRDQFVRTQDYRRIQLVRQALAGDKIHQRVLDYPLDAQHLGLVAWGSTPDMVMRRLQQQLDCQSLLVPGDDGTLWAWLGAARPVRGQATRALNNAIPDGSWVACGTWASGRAGFRQTHRQAQDAYAVASRRSKPLTRYEDVALEAMALGSESRAREFVTRELGPLVSASPRSRRLRATLAAYFAAEQNAAAAAERLGVNERTVRNRLGVIEEALGYPATRRRTELDAALRFAGVVGFSNDDDMA
jgi:DNA-binding PucR family transcriptional regulator